MLAVVDQEQDVPVGQPASGSAASACAISFDAELDYVWNALRRLGVREADLDDEVNEVFLRVHRQLAQYDPSRPIRPWLFAFAARVAAAYSHSWPRLVARSTTR